MADWNLPGLGSTYTDFQAELKERDDDSAKMFDGVGTNLPVDTVRWFTVNDRFEKWNGALWGELSTLYQINVASLQGRTVNDAGTGVNVLWTADKITSTLSTNIAPSATKLETARSFTVSGDVSATPVSFDGTSDVDILVTVSDDSHNHTIANVDGLQTELSGKLDDDAKAVDSALLNNAVESETAIANTIVKRDSSSDISARTIKTNIATGTAVPADTVGIAFRINASTDSYTRYITQANMKTWISGTGLDAGTLDTLDSADFVQNATTSNLTAGYTTTVEVLGSNTIAANMATSHLKSRVLTGTLTINLPVGGEGVCEIFIDAGGANRAIVLGTGVSVVGELPDILNTKSYIAHITRWTGAVATVSIGELV